MSDTTDTAPLEATATLDAHTEAQIGPPLEERIAQASARLAELHAELATASRDLADAQGQIKSLEEEKRHILDDVARWSEPAEPDAPVVAPTMLV